MHSTIQNTAGPVYRRLLTSATVGHPITRYSNSLTVSLAYLQISANVTTGVLDRRARPSSSAASVSVHAPAVVVV